MGIVLSEESYAKLTGPQCVRVGVHEINWACSELNDGRAGDHRDFYLDAKKVLTSSDEYATLLEDAAVVDFHKPSVEAGFIAGLKAASILGNFNFEFLQSGETN